MQFTLHGARLVDATMDISRGDISIAAEHIQSLGHVPATEGNSIDATDAIVMPGFIEVHTHGGGGFNLHTTNTDEIYSYAQWAATTGVTSFLIAVVGTPGALPEQQLRSAVTVMKQGDKGSRAPGAKPLGIFLEGPYINAKRRGAHPSAWLRLPNETETERVLALTEGYLRLITLAPELPNATETMRRLVAAGVTVSIGHTDADYKQTLEAIELGSSHLTHCCNAMRPLHHREPGPIAAVAQHEHVFSELISDGIHVHPAVMDILVKIMGTERTVVITDAQACAGRSEGSFEFAGQKITVTDGAALLADGKLAGSVLTMDTALRNVLKFTHVPLQQAVRMLTLNPARSIKADERKGLLQPGYDADLLIFDTFLNLQATVCQGRLAFATDAWQKRLQEVAVL